MCNEAEVNATGRKKWKMEHSLKPSKTYSLTREEGPNRNKEFYFVKLTDSSIRAVEEYLQHKVQWLYMYMVVS